MDIKKEFEIVERDPVYDEKQISMYVTLPYDNSDDKYGEVWYKIRHYIALILPEDVRRNIFLFLWRNRWRETEWKT